VAARYEEYEAKEVELEKSTGCGDGREVEEVERKGNGVRGDGRGSLGRQVWHTPTELFKVSPPFRVSCHRSWRARKCQCPLV
jgi:hypothetical protein